MIFHKALEHIRNACNPHHESQRGTRELALIRRDALRELLNDWERLDTKARAQNAQLQAFVAHWPESDDRIQVAQDAYTFGAGYMRQLPDGSIEHIPYNEVQIHEGAPVHPGTDGLDPNADKMEIVLSGVGVLKDEG